MWVVGLSLLPQALMTFLVSPVGGRIADRSGVLLPGRLGFLLFALADLALAVPARAPLAVIWVVSALTGIAAAIIATQRNRTQHRHRPCRADPLAVLDRHRIRRRPLQRGARVPEPDPGRLPGRVP